MKIVILLSALIGMSFKSSCSGTADEPIECIKADVENPDNKCCYIQIKGSYTYYYYEYCLEFPKDMKGDEIVRTFGYYKVICNGKFMKARLLLSLLLFLVIFFK